MINADTIRTLRRLVDIGAHFVLLNDSDHTPAGVKRVRNGKARGNGGWQLTRNQPDADEIVTHLTGGGWLGILPGSLNLACLDIDNKLNGESSKPDKVSEYLRPDATFRSPGGKGWHLIYRLDYESAHRKTRYDCSSQEFGINKADVIRNQSHIKLHPDSLQQHLNAILRAAQSVQPIPPSQLTFLDDAFERNPKPVAASRPKPPPADIPHVEVRADWAEYIATVGTDAKPSDAIILTPSERQGDDYISWDDLPSIGYGDHRFTKLWMFTRRYAMRHKPKARTWQLVYRIAQEGNRRLRTPLGALSLDPKGEVLKIATSVLRYLTDNHLVNDGHQSWQRWTNSHIQAYRRRVGVTKWRIDPARIKRDARLERAMFIYGMSIRKAAARFGLGRSIAERVHREYKAGKRFSKPSHNQLAAQLHRETPMSRAPQGGMVKMSEQTLRKQGWRAPGAHRACG